MVGTRRDCIPAVTRRYLNFLVLLAAALWLTPGCSTPSGGDDVGGSDSSVIIPETTKFLSAEDLAAVDSISDDLSQLVFNQETSTLSQLNSDDVVVCGTHGEMLPYGLLRKVNGVEREGGMVTVNTEQATLTEAIEKGSLSETITLSPDQIITQTGPKRAGFSAKIIQFDGDAGIVFAFNDYELYDADGDPATRGDRVWLDGNFSFVPTMGFDIEISGFSLQKLTFEIGSDQQASIRVSAGREATFDKAEILETIELTPITFSIGPVPVVLVPRIVFRVGVNGTVTADLTTGIQSDATVRVGFGYQNGSFSPVSEFDSNADFDAPNFRDGAMGSAKVWAGPRAELAAYGIAGVYGELRGFVEGEVDGTADPWWTLSAGAEALAGVFVRVLDITIADYETDPITASIDLGNAGGPAPEGGSQVVAWSRTFQGSADFDNTENPLAVMGTPDGGSIFAGGTSSFSGGSRDAWLIKLDRLGQVSWQVAYDDINQAIAIIPHPDGGYVFLCGNVGSGIDEIRLVHVDDNGDVIWANEYSAEESIGGHTLVELNGNFIVGGMYRFGSGADMMLTAFDLNGQVLWSKSIGGDRGDQIDGMAVDGDGNIVAAGPTNSYGVSNTGFNVAKFDAQGEPIWQYVFDGSSGGNQWMHSVVADDDGNYKIVGRTGNNALVAKLSGSGLLTDSNVYDSGTYFEEAFFGLGTPDGGLIIAGSAGLGSDSDMWVIRLTPELEVLWTTTYGGPGRDDAGGTIQYGPVSTPIAVTDDEGYIFLANSDSFGESFSDVWIQKVSETGTIDYDFDSPVSTTSEAGSFQNYGLDQTATNATTTTVEITVTPLEVETLTPDPIILTHAEP
ncbi:MAG: hypothetical protein DHS20C16_15500 [Phycisphaerae bacterium]|nr:MAG: hypothetical protein DHS20C16_15500 [Phycisphaerae bacterium]